MDVLFHSAAKHYGDRTCAVLLTGMGNDGAAGMLAIRQAGGRTFAQDEKTSVVWGMPGAARKLGAVERLLPLDRVPHAISSAVAHLTERQRRA